jgi:cytochrome P450
VLEGVRHCSVLRWFSRIAATDFAVDGSTIPGGARVMLIYASANRDERKFADPDDFDITRDARDQLSWGVGVHMCGGMHLAKMEMEVLLEALIEHCDSITAGDPELISNRGLYGFSRLPMELRSAH